VLELIGLTRRYGDVTALDGLSFTVAAGRVTGFLGPNGAGKTTTMRAICGVAGLDAGQVLWAGSPVTLEHRLRFGYMPEERGLYGEMAVLPHLEYLARLHGLDVRQARAAAHRWADRLGLGALGAAKIESLSLGNQQRVQLAAALVHDPDLLVLDEPFSGLDPVGIEAMSSVLAERAAAGATVLFSSHQLDLVESLCEAVVIVERGRLVTAGDVDDLASGGPRRLAVRVADDADGNWTAGLETIAVVEDVTDGMVVLHLRTSDDGDDAGAQTQRVLAHALAHGPVEHFALVRRRLSEVFREALGSAELSGSVR